MFPLLSTLRLQDRPQVGGKAANLGELAALGVATPRGFVLPAEIGDRFLRYEQDVNVPLEMATQHSEGHCPPTDMQIQPLAPAVADLLRRTTAYLQLTRVSVRSSATLEDSPTLSFAGLFDSFLNVALPDIEAAVRSCWLSARSGRASAYCARQGLPADGLKMAVIVQDFIPSEISGVCFTINPVTGNKNEMMIETVLGLGEALASGRVTPDTYVYDVAERRIKTKQISEQDCMCVAADRTGIIDSPLGEELGRKQKLSDRLILSVADLCRKIAEHYGSPQDIEFGVKEGNIYFFQTRHITTLKP
jgi:pyruvate,water dikinase